ncbi:hypothetical protein Emed_000039 [Eimeria media]
MYGKGYSSSTTNHNDIHTTATPPARRAAPIATAAASARTATPTATPAAAAAKAMMPAGLTAENSWARRKLAVTCAIVFCSETSTGSARRLCSSSNNNSKGSCLVALDGFVLYLRGPLSSKSSSETEWTKSAELAAAAAAAAAVYAVTAAAAAAAGKANLKETPLSQEPASLQRELLFFLSRQLQRFGSHYVSDADAEAADLLSQQVIFLLPFDLHGTQQQQQQQPVSNE